MFEVQVVQVVHAPQDLPVVVDPVDHHLAEGGLRGATSKFKTKGL